MQPDLLDLPRLAILRRCFPLLHCLTSDVVPALTADILLALTFRRECCQQRLTRNRAVMWGHASNMMALAGLCRGGRDVDSVDRVARTLPVVQRLTQHTGATVVVTAAAEYVADGADTRTVTGDGILMMRLVGTGCALSVVVAACSALPGDWLDNVAARCGFMKYAGFLAGPHSQGPGSVAVALLDALSALGEGA